MGQSKKRINMTQVKLYMDGKGEAKRIRESFKGWHRQGTSKIAYALVVAVLGSMTTVWANTALPASNPQVAAVAQNVAANGQADVPTLRENGSSVTAEGRFLLRGVRFTGELPAYTDELQTLAKPLVNQEITLGQLQALTAQLTSYLRQHDYPAGTAFLPPQENRDGTIEIRLLLGQLENVTIQNQSRLQDGLAKGIAKQFPTGVTLTNDAVAPTLRQLQGLPGIVVKGELTPGQTVGSTDLTLTLTDSKPVGGYVYVDNYGQAQSGRNRLGLQISLYNPTGYGDTFTIGGLWSNENLRNYIANYDRPVGTKGSHVGVSYSRLNYSLGGALGSTNTDGLARTLGIYGSTPLIKSANAMTSLTYGYNYRVLESTVNAYNRKAHSHAVNVGLSGYRWSPQTYLGYNLIGTWGTLQRQADVLWPFINPKTGQLGFVKGTQYGGDGTGTFYKLNTDLTYSRLLAPRLRLQLNWHSQLANQSLDGSEQFVLGGPNGIRAYGTNAGGGDTGYQATIALHYQTPVTGLTVSPFVDWGATFLKGAVAPNSPSAYHLAGWGLGLTYQPQSDWNLAITYARKMKALPVPDANDSSKGRWWAQVGYRF